MTREAGRTPWYELVDELEANQVIYHWNADQERFVGCSVVSTPREVDEETGERVVSLRGFVPLRSMVGLAELKARRGDLEVLRSSLEAKYPRQSLYQPFQFRADGLRPMSNYFAKFPADFQEQLFGVDGLAESGLAPPPAEEGPDVRPNPSGVRVQYLKPFKPKADTDYVAHVQGGIRRRGRSHETLVNDFAKWLEDRGFEVGRNAAIDLGLASPPLIIEAKTVVSWAKSIREAVGQLYEYRFFQVVPPESQLVFLSSTKIPSQWHEYLEHDRGIGCAWRGGDKFQLSPLTTEQLRLPPVKRADP